MLVYAVEVTVSSKTSMRFLAKYPITEIRTIFKSDPVDISLVIGMLNLLTTCVVTLDLVIKGILSKGVSSPNRPT